MTDLKDFAKLSPAEMKQELLDSPATALLAEYLRKNPIVDGDMTEHIAWYKAKMRAERPDFNPEVTDPNDTVIRLSFLIALEKMAIDDGIAIPGNLTRN